MQTLLSQLISELREHPEETREFLEILRMTVGPWEPLGSENALAPTGFSRNTIFGESVASIVVGHPKWQITIEGEIPKESTPVFHHKDAEQQAKDIVDNLLKERNYIVVD